MLHQQAACFCMSLSCIYRHIHDDGRAYTMVAAAQVAWICFAGILVAFAWATIRGAAWQQKRLESSASNGSSCMGCDAGGSTAGGRDTGCGAGGARGYAGLRYGGRDTGCGTRGSTGGGRDIIGCGTRGSIGGGRCGVRRGRFHCGFPYTACGEGGFTGRLAIRGVAPEAPPRHGVRPGRFNQCAGFYRLMPLKYATLGKTFVSLLGRFALWMVFWVPGLILLVSCAETFHVCVTGTGGCLSQRFATSCDVRSDTTARFCGSKPRLFDLFGR